MQVPPVLLLFCRSVMSDSATLWSAACQASLSLIISQRLLKLISVELVMSSNHLVFCHLLLVLYIISFSSCLQSLPTSQSFLKSQLFASGGQKYWSFSFSISPFSEYSGLISFRMDWLDLLAVQWTLKSLLPTPQFKNINSSALSLLCGPILTSIHD